MKKYLPLIIAILALAAPMLTPSCANTTTPPSGGDKDTIPPYITNIRPLPGVTMFPLEKGRIVFEFNENIKVKTPSDIFLSPYFLSFGSIASRRPSPKRLTERTVTMIAKPGAITMYG